MTRNVKRFLAASLLSLMPSVALAAQVEIPDFLSARSEYVSVGEESFQVPVRKGPRVDSIAPANEDLLNFNQTGAPAYLRIQIQTGTFNGIYNAVNPAPNLTWGGYQVGAPAPTPTAPVVQQYFWTLNPANPAGTKTCVWRLTVSTDGVSCSAQVSSGTYGGAICTLDTVNSFVDPTTCYAAVYTSIQ